jgi:hypothetical protein
MFYKFLFYNKISGKSKIYDFFQKLTSDSKYQKKVAFVENYADFYKFFRNNKISEKKVAFKKVIKK